MLYTPLTNKALQTAYHAHCGQTDRGGVPYIFHPYHLAEQMETEEEICTALLHDVVEDTSVTLQDLAKDFSPRILAAVALLTHRAGTDYFDYVRAIKADPLAKKVKLADLAHNSDETRIAHSSIPPHKREQLRQKYSRARAILLGEEE